MVDMPQGMHGSFFAGRLIAVPETRQLDVLADLLQKRGADVLRCPLVAILDAPDAGPVLDWIERFIAKPPDLFVIYTGEGIQRLIGFAAKADLRQRFVSALAVPRKLCRGPKPRRALKQLGLNADIDALAPTTAGIVDTLSALDLTHLRVAVQLYGDKRIPELDEFLAAKGIVADFVAPYVYASAADDERVLDLVARLHEGEIDAIAFTSKSQVDRLFKLARERGLENRLQAALARTCVAAIGPVVAATLEAAGVSVDTMPEESFFMKPLVTALAERFGAPEQSKD
jgi:uroporphyrinogen-III synthase